MRPETLSAKWVNCPKPVDFPRLRLICFPPAGAGTIIYSKWAAHLLPDVEMWIMRLPGREIRLSDRLFFRLPPLIESMAETLIPHLNQPYLIFGHCLGSLIGFELTRYLRGLSRPMPLHLLLSGHRAPHRPPLNQPIHQANDDQFLARIKAMGGAPDAVFEIEEIVEYMLPPFRADFTIWENYQYLEDKPLDIPMSVFGSYGDRDAHEEDILAWEQHTTKEFESKMFHGGHFYFLKDPKPLLTLINISLQKYL